LTRPDATQRDPVALATDAGIHRLRLPTPFPVGPVNLYLLEDEPLTLIDTGPNSGTSLDLLEQQLAVHGHEIEDLRLIVLTHQHMDHTGLLQIVARRSGAEVAAFAPLAGWLGDYRQSAAAEDDYAQSVLRRHGVPQDLVALLGVVSAALHSYGSRGTVTRPLGDGDQLRLRDRTLHVAHRPGHSPSDLTFWDAERRILIAGDHLLAHISSNPVIHRPLNGQTTGPRPTPLVDYVNALKGTQALPAQLVVGGHGEAVTAHVELIDERLRLHERRAGKILRMLRDGPLTAHGIAVQMWGSVAVTQAFLTLSEVLGHLDLLRVDGKVAEIDDGELSRFAAV
jgi:glyoxylase-like metal-dependent hydrolase (beta-lactamase superfamily II)